MPPPKTMSIAATLAAHRSKTAITEKYQPQGQGNSVGAAVASAGNNDIARLNSFQSTRSSLISPPRPQLQSKSTSEHSGSSSAAAAATASVPATLPIHEDQVVSDATGSQINACQYNTTGEYILTGGVDRTVRLWNPDTKFCIKSYEAHGWEILDLAVSPENGKFASCGGDKTVFLWDVLSGTTIRRFSGHTQLTMFYLYTALARERGGFQRRRNGACVWIIRRNNSTLGLQITTTNTNSNTGGTKGQRDIHPDQRERPAGRPITSVSFSKDGNCVLASSLDNTVRLMDRANGQLLNAYKGHKNSQYKIRSCLSNSDAHVLSGSEDGKIYIWDLIEGDVVYRIEAHSKIVSAIAYHPTKDRMCSASVDGSVRTWTANPSSSE
ncbi:WD repeat-containing protein 83 [Mortierella sp. GBA30]|nr:WD repeat-containing protein 83 [Mortierella sp. GBA30]